jgi:hypothetical protein
MLKPILQTIVRAVAIALVLTATLGFSQTTTPRAASARTLEQAIVGNLIPVSLGSPSATTVYLPGFGLDIRVVIFANSSFRLDTTLDQLRALLIGLTSTITGLQRDEWVAVTLIVQPGTASNIGLFHIVARLRQGDAASFEVWVNEVKR